MGKTKGDAFGGFRSQAVRSHRGHVVERVGGFFGPRLFAAIGAMAWRECFDEAFGSFRSQAVRSHRGHGVEREFC